MKLKFVAAAVLAVVASQVVGAAESGSLLVRARAVYLAPGNEDSTPLALNINSKTIPEVDFSYFFTKNLAAELILTYPQKHDIKAGNTKIGSVKHLPPTLTLQYHFTQDSVVTPYIGAGINYTRFSSVDLPAGFTIKKNSFGYALQVGMDIALSKKTVLNIDVKKVKIKTDVSANGTKVGTLNIDPLLFGIGVGYRF
jgi:outer membrane protein